MRSGRAGPMASIHAYVLRPEGGPPGRAAVSLLLSDRPSVPVLRWHPFVRLHVGGRLLGRGQVVSARPAFLLGYFRGRGRRRRGGGDRPHLVSPAHAPAVETAADLCGKRDRAQLGVEGLHPRQLRSAGSTRRDGRSSAPSGSPRSTRLPTLSAQRWTAKSIAAMRTGRRP